MRFLVLVAASFAVSAHALDLQNPLLTPGVARQVSMQELCRRGSSKDARYVTSTEKAFVYREYGMKNHEGACPGKQGCEVDHLISLELGGANDVKNLWPQPYTGTWNAHMKDRLENRLHKLVCTGKISLQEAQSGIANDWISMYKKYVGQR